MEDIDLIKEKLNEINSIIQPGTPKGDSVPNLVSAIEGLGNELNLIEKLIKEKHDV